MNHVQSVYISVIYHLLWCSEVYGNIPLGPAAVAVYSHKPPPQQVVYH